MALKVNGKVRYKHVPILSSWDFGLFRSPGPGLGNLLFPIARAVIGQSKVGGLVLFPTIRQLKFGPYLRFEEDKRTYGDIFRRRSYKEWCHWTKFYCDRIISSQANDYIVYMGLGNQFCDLVGYNSVLRSYFEDRLAENVSYEEIDVAIHLRLGDFAKYNSEYTGQNFKNSKEFYQIALEKAHHLLGERHLKVFVFTDAPEEYASEYLGANFLCFEKKFNALHSILKMSRAKIIITSRSTFSLWGQFLGDTCAIWPKEFKLEKYKFIDPMKDIII